MEMRGWGTAEAPAYFDAPEDATGVGMRRHATSKAGLLARAIRGAPVGRRDADKDWVQVLRDENLGCSQ